ncbi:MAG: DNA alkylation repair protein [Clostridia bacterium]|nr:DNA alkylation repair protein [Clostridia bacterium]
MTLKTILLSMQDLKYKKFHSALMPTVNPDLVIGVRMPELRKFAKTFAKTHESADFLKALPHKYYEENNIHALIIQQEPDFDCALELTEKFLPHIDNWATCDMFRPKVFGKNPEKLISHIYRWLDSDKPYTIRFGIGLLHSFYLDKNFKPEFLEKVSQIQSDEYYVNMMIAWYFQTALVKQYDSAIPYITGHRLSPWVHNKTIRKSVESLKFSKEMKEYFKSLTVKD